MESPIPHSVRLLRVQLCAVLANFGFANLSIFDSAQANTVTLRRLTLQLHENELLGKTIIVCLSGAQMASIHETKKCQTIS